MVSVVIPNHNYARFLGKRLASVIHQLYRDMEIIFLDDASTDRSVEIAEAILAASGLPYRVLRNPVNSGSVFAQWQRGLDLARGEYVWFAEADDACDATLVGTLAAILDAHPAVGLAYAESAVLDVHDRVTDTGFYRRIHRLISSEKWNCAYVNDGTNEVVTALAVMNTIPNASGVLFRRSVLLDVGGVVQKYRGSGDWATYINVLERAAVAYVPEPLNYNRFHPNRVTTRSHRDGAAFPEAVSVLADVLARFEVSEETQRKFVHHYLDQKFLNGYTPLDGEEVVSALIGVIAPDVVYTVMTERLHGLARFRLANEADLLYRLTHLTPRKVLKRILPRKRI